MKSIKEKSTKNTYSSKATIMGVKKTMKNWEKVFTTFELVRTITENAKNSHNPPRKKPTQ